MNERPALQVAHSGRDLRRHVHEYDRVDVLAVSCTQIVEQVAAAHELRDDVEGGLAGAHAQQLHQVRVAHLLHYGRLLEEVLKCHCVVLQGFHRHLRVIVGDLELPNIMP